MSEFTIFSAPWCSYCTRAKTALRARGLPYREVNIDAEGREEMNRLVNAATGEGARTIPQIFLGDTYVGGFDQLNALLQQAVADAESKPD